MTIRTATPSVLVFATLATAVAACDSAAPEPDARASFAPDTTVTDSAGIRVVTNHGPAWPDTGGWRIDTIPEVDVGARDDEPWYILYGAEYTALLDDGQISVPNRGSQEVFFYDRRGRFQAIAGGAGEGPGELPYINTLGPHPEGVFVTDGARTILVFDERHRLVRDVRLTEHARRGQRFWPLGALADGSWVGVVLGDRDRSRTPGRPGSTRAPSNASPRTEP